MGYVSIIVQQQVLMYGGQITNAFMSDPPLIGRGVYVRIELGKFTQELRSLQGSPSTDIADGNAVEADLGHCLRPQPERALVSSMCKILLW